MFSLWPHRPLPPPLQTRITTKHPESFLRTTKHRNTILRRRKKLPQYYLSLHLVWGLLGLFTQAFISPLQNNRQQSIDMISPNRGAACDRENGLLSTQFSRAKQATSGFFRPSPRPAVSSQKRQRPCIQTLALCVCKCLSSFSLCS